MKRNDLINVINKNSSKVLSILASVGVVGTAYFSAKGTINAVEKIKKEKVESKKEKIKVVIPCYIPAISFGLSTIACILGINVLNKKKQEAITSAYMLLSNSYSEYRNKIKEKNGKSFDLEVRDELALKKFPDREIPKNKIRFYEEFSERYFDSTMEDVYAAIYHYNRNFQLRGNASLNEFYDFLEIPHIDSGDYLGFSWHEMAEDGLTPWIDINVRRAKRCDDTEFCIISFVWNPIANYENWEPDYWLDAKGEQS